MATIHPRARLIYRGAIWGTLIGSLLSIMFSVFVIILFDINNILNVVIQWPNPTSEDTVASILYVVYATVVGAAVAILVGILPSIALGFLTGFLIGSIMAVGAKYLSESAATIAGIAIPASIAAPILIC